LKYKLLYLTPILVILLGITEKRFRNGSRDLTWKDLFSKIIRKKENQLKERS